MAVTRSPIAALVILALAAFVAVFPTIAAAQGLGDNADSVAVIVGNQTYRQTSPVDFAANDAAAMKDFLVRGLGFQERNVFVLKDATLNELNQAFGSESSPTRGRLWRSVVAGRSNVFVYYSGHGVPNLKTRQPYLLPADGDPNFAESGYALETLYRNLELVKQKVGPDRQVIVMVDACFTGETGRKGESMLAASAPGFAPARPKAPDGVIRLAATSGATPANWDQSTRLGLFTSRFLMGAAGLARPDGDKAPTPWAALQAYVVREVETAARRDVGREQTPEIDPAALAVPLVEPGPAICAAVERARDEAAWREADHDGSRGELERYVARCGSSCGYRDQAMARLLNRNRGEEAKADDETWNRLSADGKYQDYLALCDKGEDRICAYRPLALGYLGKAPGEAAAPRTAALTPAPTAPDVPQMPPAPPAGQRVAVDRFPDRKSGLWEVTSARSSGPHVPKQEKGSKECVGPESEEAGRRTEAASTCRNGPIYRTAEGFEKHDDCSKGGVKASISGAVTGDFTTWVRTELNTSFSSGRGRSRTTLSHLDFEARRIGDCPSGMAPGDKLTASGKMVRHGR